MLDVSPDGTFVVYCSVSEAADKESGTCLKIELETGKTYDLLAKVRGDNTAAVMDPVKAMISPDGKSVAIPMSDRKNVHIVGLAAGKVATISKTEEFSCAWGDKGLLVSVAGRPVETFDASGKWVEQGKLIAELLSADQAGKKLLVHTNAKDPTTKPTEADAHRDNVLAVVSPEGKMIKVIGREFGDLCPAPKRMSRNGEYVAVVWMQQGVRLRILSTTTDQVIDVEEPYSQPMAVGDTGEGIAYSKGLWTRDGKWQGGSGGRPLAATIFGGELFVALRDDEGVFLRATPFPKPNSSAQPATAPATE